MEDSNVVVNKTNKTSYSKHGNGWGVGASICIFLGEDSDTWKRPIPEDKTIHVNVFIDPETGEIEYFRHNMPFHMQLHINHSEAEDISPDGTIAVDEDEDEEWQTIPEKTYDVDYGDNIMSESD
jgi:hypothetical protein